MGYHLVLEYLPGDFMPVDINTLLDNPYKLNFNSLRNIDEYTKKYMIDEIYENIRKMNIVPEKYLNGTLKIINDHKYRYDVLTKNNEFNLEDFLKNNLNDKLIMNKLVNIYIKYKFSYVDEFKEAVSHKNLKEIINILSTLNYEDIRKIYMYIANSILK